MRNIYDSRFSTFVSKKETYLNQVESYLNQLQMLRNDIIECQTKKVLSDVYNETISVTFDKLYKNLRYTFTESTDFANKRKVTTYSYLERLN